MNLYFRFRGRYVCAPPKCGGTALYCSALGIEPGNRSEFYRASLMVTFVSPEKALASGLPVILAVREPVSRFASLWRDKCRDGDANLGISGLSPDDLMDWIDREPLGDPHWAPQSEHWRPGIETVDYREFGAAIGLRMPQINVSTPLASDPAMPAARIARHYAADADLYRWAA